MPESPKRRVVITGVGVTSPLGLTKEGFWNALAQGQSGVRQARTLPATALPTPYAAEAWDFTGDVADFGALEGDLKKAVRKGLKLMCRECQMGVAAAMRAWDDAGLKEGAVEPDRVGVVFGSDYMLSQPEDFAAGIHRCAATTGQFEYARWGGEGMRELTPLWLLKYLPNMPACHIAIFKDLQGPNNSLTVREASSHLAVGEAFHTISRGHAEVMLGGATGTRVHAMRTLHVVQQEEVAPPGTAPEAASRPFDLARAGMVLGEGAGSVVLEELEFARRRGAHIYAEVLGRGSSSVASRQGVADRATALANAMRAALREAQLTPAQVGHIAAHGLATRSSDVAEAQALAQVFGERARQVPLVAAKSYFGNLGAGSGVVELIASLLALEHGELFRVLNYETPDPDCPVRAVTDAEQPPGDVVLCASVTPMGQASTLVVGRAR